MAVPAGTGGRILGVLEICWPHGLAPQPPQIQPADRGAGRAVRAHPGGVHASPRRTTARTRAVARLIDLADGLLDPALVLCPHLDAGGRLTDFRIRHANDRFADPAGRPRSERVGALLLEAYPLAAGDGGLFDKVEHVHATGEPFRAERMPSPPWSTRCR